MSIRCSVLPSSTKAPNNPNLVGRKKGWRGFEQRGITKPVLMRFAIAAVLVIAGTACKHNKRANTTVAHRAAFDFPCEKSQLTLTVLDTEGARNMASQIGVHGCGKKAVYAYYPDSDTWLLDGAISPVEADYQHPVHVTKGKDQKRSEKKSGRQTTKAEKHGGMKPAEPAPVEPAPVEPAPVEQ
jgi:hypothetical protein